MKIKSNFFSSFFIISLVCFQGKLFAQNNSEAESLFGNGSILNTNDLGFFYCSCLRNHTNGRQQCLHI